MRACGTCGAGSGVRREWRHTHGLPQVSDGRDLWRTRGRFARMHTSQSRGYSSPDGHVSQGNLVRRSSRCASWKRSRRSGLYLLMIACPCSHSQFWCMFALSHAAVPARSLATHSQRPGPAAPPPCTGSTRLWPRNTPPQTHVEPAPTPPASPLCSQVPRNDDNYDNTLLRRQLCTHPPAMAIQHNPVRCIFKLESQDHNARMSLVVSRPAAKLVRKRVPPHHAPHPARRPTHGRRGSTHTGTRHAEQ